MTGLLLQSDRVKFAKPPLVELVVSLFHLPIRELKAQHVGLYWNLIRDRFPLCEQKPVVVTEGQPFTPEYAEGELFPLARFWFFSEKHPTLIQLQRNAFMLNWRRTAEAEYPHYEAVIKDFWEEIERYTGFVRDVVNGSLDVVQRCELTYVNLIEPNEFFSSPSDVAAVLPSLSGIRELATDGRELSGINATITYRVSSSLLIDLTLRLGRRMDKDSVVLGFELKAHGTPSDLSPVGARAWYDAAHDATYRLFLNATSLQLQEKLWKPR
jgi:uncharacterized protein (TIGR04255 family)